MVVAFVINRLDTLIQQFCDLFPPFTFLSRPDCVTGMLVIILVGVICGSVGAQVVGNRMAFFSDALAHCAFAGVALAVLVLLLAGVRGAGVQGWITLIMVVFGVVVGLLIAFVRENTGLASDTVIGVFFAGAMGLGGMFVRFGNAFNLTLESFMFGDPLGTTATDIVIMFVLLLITLGFLAWFYNPLVLTSFNPSLARSRQVPVRLCQYLFIALLGVIINLCLNIVGTLLINALLIVPAAAAANVSRNMRQLFWASILLCVGVGVGGEVLSWEISIQLARANHPGVGAGGTIIVLSVVVFVASMLVRPWVQQRRLAAPPVSSLPIQD
jgi:zinc transport system permease protein